MKRNKLPLLIALAVVFGGAGLMLNHARSPESEVVALNKPLIAGLKDDVNKITALKITGPENKLVVELKKSEKGWVAANKGGYPADVARVREFLLKLSDSRLREEKTSNKERYAALGLEDLAAADAKGVGLEIEGLAKPVKLLIGSFSSNGGQGHFVRFLDQPQSYLASGSIRPETGEAQWLLADIANIGSARVRRVDITPPTGTKLSVEKTDPVAVDYTVLNVPKGRELSSASVGNGVSTLMDSLRFDDVMPADAAQPEASGLYQARFLTQEGVVVNVSGWEKDSKSYLRLSAELDATRSEEWLLAEQNKAEAEAKAKAETEAAAKAAAETKPAEGATAPADAPKPETPAAAPAAPAFDAAKFREEKLADLKKEVDELNARTTGWTYVVANWKFANIKKSMDDMLKPLESKSK